MPALSTLSSEALAELRSGLRGEYEALKAQGLKLDMTRGKPASDQLDLAAEMLALPGNRDHRSTSLSERARDPTPPRRPSHPRPPRRRRDRALP